MHCSMRGFLLVGLVILGAPACAAQRATVSAAAPGPHMLQVLLHDHLAFGVRLEDVALLLDGSPAYEATNAKAGLEPAVLRVAPGAHTLTVLARASEPCGLFDEPRMRLTVRSLETFLVGDGPATLDIDLYASAATSDPAQLISVRVAGKRLALGAEAREDGHGTNAQCESGDSLCELDGRIDHARSRGDSRQVSCYAARRDEMRRWRDALDDSFAMVSREGITTSEVESAQLRARYAESRLRSLTLEARACESDARPGGASAEVERKVDAVCPTPDVTASRKGW
jgi:hypothetical protein